MKNQKESDFISVSESKVKKEYTEESKLGSWNYTFIILCLVGICRDQRQCVCVCVCVLVREGERWEDRRSERMKRERELGGWERREESRDEME